MQIILLVVSAGVLESEGYEKIVDQPFEWYPKNVYPANFHKMYEIEVAEGKLRKIEFTGFELETSSRGQCLCNYVMVVDAEDDDGVQVHFKTDETIKKKSWRLVYTELQNNLINR